MKINTKHKKTREKGMVKETKFFILDRPYQRTLKSFVKKILRSMQTIGYKVITLFNRPNMDPAKKYRVSICAIFKDEGEFLREWLEYHLIVGVDHFYLYNNDSSDGYYEILEPFIKRGIVTLVNWPGRQVQIQAYENAIKTYAYETKWLGFIDIDEYVVPCEETSIYEVLKAFDKKASSVLIYWKVFGSSGLIERQADKLLAEQFILSFPKFNDIGKCFYNTDFEYAFENEKNDCMHHILWCTQKGVAIPPVNIQNNFSFQGHNLINKQRLPIQINHYVTKSYQDYFYKTYKKTDVYFEQNPRNIEHFFEIDSLCTEPDYTIYRFMSQLKLSMSECSEKGNVKTMCEKQ